MSNFEQYETLAKSQNFIVIIIIIIYANLKIFDSFHLNKWCESYDVPCVVGN